MTVAIATVAVIAVVQAETEGGAVSITVSVAAVVIPRRRAIIVAVIRIAVVGVATDIAVTRPVYAAAQCEHGSKYQT
jgi:hypothetical protein